MSFDPTITAGSLIILTGNIVVFLVFIIRLEGKINLLNLRIDHMEQAFEVLAKTDSRLATFEARLTSHDGLISTTQKDVYDLRRGTGWVTKPRDHVNGEYP